MASKIFSIVSVIFILTLSLPTETYANPYDSITTQGWDSGLHFENFISTGAIQSKRGEPYDEKKDPALRRGTENTEQPQSSFFAIPALVIGILLAFLFFNKD